MQINKAYLTKTDERGISFAVILLSENTGQFLLTAERELRDIEWKKGGVISVVLNNRVDSVALEDLQPNPYPYEVYDSSYVGRFLAGETPQMGALILGLRVGRDLVLGSNYGGPSFVRKVRAGKFGDFPLFLGEKMHYLDHDLGWFESDRYTPGHANYQLRGGSISSFEAEAGDEEEEEAEDELPVTPMEDEDYQANYDDAEIGGDGAAGMEVDDVTGMEGEEPAESSLDEHTDEDKKMARRRTSPRARTPHTPYNANGFRRGKRVRTAETPYNVGTFE